MESSTHVGKIVLWLKTRMHMTMRRKLVVGNWKMHGSRPANAELLAGMLPRGPTAATWPCACPSRS
jgi:hypothetical protein